MKELWTDLSDAAAIAVVCLAMCATLVCLIQYGDQIKGVLTQWL